jgi:hypothetical protein
MLETPGKESKRTWGQFRAAECPPAALLATTFATTSEEFGGCLVTAYNQGLRANRQGEVPLVADHMAKSEYLMEPNVKAVPTKLIPQYGDSHLRLRLVLKLHGLALGGSDVGTEG